MNPNFTYLVNSRELSTNNPFETELQLNKQKNYLFNLSHLGIIGLEGDKSIEFLQGQLTADISQVSDIKMIQSAQCNLKGRILSLLDVINWNGFKLVLPQDLIENTLNSLSKTALLSKVHCKKQPEFSLFGFYLQNLDDLIPDNLFLPKDLYAQAYGDSFCYYHLGDGFYIFLIDNNKVETFTQAFIDRHQFLGSLTWHTLRLYKQQISIYPETRGLFLPHRIDLHQSSYLSFNKGCYKGQEIIARTHYRATLKHTLNLYVAHTKEPLFSGEKLYKADEEKEVGELIDYSYLSDNKYLIAVSILKEASNEVRLEKQDQVITLEQV